MNSKSNKVGMGDDTRASDDNEFMNDISSELTFHVSNAEPIAIYLVSLQKLLTMRNNKRPNSFIIAYLNILTRSLIKTWKLRLS